MDTSKLIEKARKPVFITTGLISAYALIGFVILPKVLENQIPKMIESETGRKAELEKIDFNPFSLELSLQGFSMQEKDLQTFVSFDEFFVNVQVWSSLRNLALVIDEVSLLQPYVRLEILPDDKYNFSDLLSDSEEEVEEETDENSEIFPLIIHHIDLAKGKFESVDSLHTEPVISQVQDLNLHLESFSTLLGDGSMLNFSLALGSGGSLNWQGDFGVNPLFSGGELKLEGLKFAKVWETFLQERVNFKWVDGTQLLKFKYAFSYENEEMVFKLTEGHLLTENLKFTAKEDTTEIITIPYFSVEGITFDLNEQAIDIAKIESRAADFNAWFSQSGELNYQTVFAGQEPQIATDDPEEKQDEVVDDIVEVAVDEVVDNVVEVVDDAVIDTKPWEINIQDIALNESKISFSDKRKKAPVLMNITALDIGLKNTHLSAGELLQMTTNEGYFTLQDFVIKNQKSQSADASTAQKMMDIPYFSIAGIDFDLSKQAINIATIESRDAGFDAWFNASGELNYQAAFAGQGSEPEAKTTVTEKKPDEAAQPWEINIQDIALNKSKFNFADGRQKKPVLMNISALDIGLKNYHLLAGEALQMTANQGRLNLQNFALKTAPKSKLVHVPNLQVSGLGFNLQEQSLNIKSVNTRDAVIKAWLAKNGEINYQSLFAADANKQVEQGPVAETQGNNESPWKIALEEFKIDNYALEFTDYSTRKPVSLNLSALNFSMAHFNNQQGTKLPLSFSTKVNRKGKIKVSGQTVLEPFSSNLKLAINNIGIASFQPYINQGAHLDVVGGDFNTHGKLAISQAKGGDLKLNYKGNLDVKGLHTRDQILNQDFLKWQLLKLSGIDFNLQPGKLKIKTINLDKPYARVTIKKDNNTNINDVIVVAETTKNKSAKKAKKKSSPFVYNIGKVTITGGESDFSDYSLILPFVVKLNDLGGGIENISSNKKAQTKLNLKGKTFDLSPVEIQGNFDANLDDLDIAMHYKSLPLPFLSPYMVEFSGNKIEKGKLSLDLMYQVKDGQLSAKNNLLIDQLELGEEVENPDAVDLPLALAIALLKDKDGKIIINMPLQGSMDDPDFSIGPLIFDAFVNLLTKAVASPFTAIGSFLGSDEDFSVVTFKAGSAELSADELVKLDGLATALKQKPDLSLEVKGEAYTNQDWPAMKEQALLDELKQMRSEELKKEGEIKLPEYIELSDDDYQRLLADLFIQKFPDLGKRSFFGTPKLIYDDMGEFSTVASNMLQGMIKPDNNKLLILSLARARNIARYMDKAGGIDQSRVFILDGRVTADAENNELNTNLSLKMQ